MFEELGYSLYQNEFTLEYDGEFTREVVFYLQGDDKKYICKRHLIDPNLHKAITQQMKELGWIE